MGEIPGPCLEESLVLRDWPEEILQLEERAAAGWPVIAHLAVVIGVAHG